MIRLQPKSLHLFPTAHLRSEVTAYSCPLQALFALFILPGKAVILRASWLNQLLHEVNSPAKALAYIYQTCVSHKSTDQKVLEAPPHSEHSGSPGNQKTGPQAA